MVKGTNRYGEAVKWARYSLWKNNGQMKWEVGMAERRMFSKEIIDSDAFLDMPVSTQNLIFPLGNEGG